MADFLYLASKAAEAEAESGFGFQFDLLESNVINLAILIGLLVVYGGKFIGNILSERRAKIEQEIKDAENRAQQAATALAEAQQKLAQAQAEAEKIRTAADITAKNEREAILAKGTEEISRLKQTAVQELSTEQAKVIAELKERITALALEKVEAQLKATLDGSKQEKLIERGIAQLGGI